MASEEYMTVGELAALCRLPKSTVYAMNSRGDAPPRLKIGRQVVYARSAVDAWLKTRLVASA